MTVDPEIPVPPVHYGGIERIVHMLVCGLQRRGHEVHLFAHRQSRIPGRLVPYGGARSGSAGDTLRNAAQISRYVRRLGGVDLVHSFGRLAYLLPLFKSGVPKIQSYQRHISTRSVRLGTLLGGSSISFTACSENCARGGRAAGGRWRVIPNGVPMADYHFNPRVGADAPFVFLGRVERIKGAHTAIEVSRRAGRRLVIAGNHATKGEEWEYFRDEILPRCDGERVRYEGPVGDSRKNSLLGQAAALLFPIEWEEPFGIVMAEALACGTPVIAFARGSVPEVIRHGETGFVCRTAGEMTEAAAAVGSIDRRACRRSAEECFSDRVITDAYERLYYESL